MNLFFASANQHKISEIQSLLPSSILLLGLKDIDLNHDIPEPGQTIEENSFLKASYLVNFLKENNKPTTAVFADDSGLEVIALNNAPGVHSARYAGEPKNDQNNNQKLLSELKLITDRRARFVTVITLLIDNQIHYFEGEIKGTIAFEPKGNSGFGYDPLFIPRGYRSTFAELGSEVKNAISHRAQAVKKLIAFLDTLRNDH
jgi:XTP/dITP diphosphohydrolase